MSIYRILAFYWKAIKKNRAPVITVLLLMAALAISEPWYVSEPYETIYSATSWFYLTIGLITGFLVLCRNIYDIFSKQSVLIRVGRRSDLAVDIFLLVLLAAIVCAALYMFAFTGVSVCFTGKIPFSVLSVIMTAAALGMYLCFCGISFFIISLILDRPGAAFLIIMLFPGADGIFDMIKGSPLLLKYVFPPQTLLHVSGSVFAVGGAVLAVSILIVFTVFTAMMVRKDFLR